MIENTPPTIHSVSSVLSLCTAPATIDGVPKMPAPTMRPTIIVIASNSDSVCFGTPRSSAISALLDVVGRAAHFAALGELRGPLGFLHRFAFADLHDAVDGVAIHATGEFVALVAGAALGLRDEIDRFAVEAASHQRAVVARTHVAFDDLERLVESKLVRHRLARDVDVSAP